MKLISMTDFVLEQKQDVMSNSFSRILNYANFLKQPLTLGMFIPCDEEGNVLEEPCSIGVGNDFYLQRTEDYYKQAKERVLFEGFEICESYGEKALYSIKNNVFVGSFIDGNFTFFSFHKTIEDLVKYNLTLTDSAIKQLGI